MVALALPFSSFAATPAAVNLGSNGNTSLNWAGYVANQGTFTSVSGTWTLPSIPAATSVAADATWVGIGGTTNQDLIQGGTQAITNSSGTVSYEAWYEILPQATQPIPIPISAGDSVSVSITETSLNQWQISFRNNTTNQNYQASVQYTSSHSSAEWIEEMPSSPQTFLPLDNFGSVSFMGGSAVQNGNQVTISGSNAQMLTMITGNGQALATPSALGSDGASFTVTRSSVAATPSGRVRVVLRGRSWRRTGVGVEGYTPSPRSGRGNIFSYWGGRGGRFSEQFREQKNGFLRNRTMVRDR